MWEVRGFKPLASQFELLTQIGLPPVRPGPRFFPVNMGRNAGKTTLAPEIIWEGATCDWDDDQGPPHVRIIADTYEHGQMIFDPVWDEANTILRPLVHHVESDRNLIVLNNPNKPGAAGATIQLLSADNPKMLTGHNKITLAVTDESQFISDEAWRQFWPCLNIRHAVWVGFGVCQGQGQYRTMSLRGKEPDDWPEYRTYTFPSTSNPYFTPDLGELAKREHTEQEYAELYDATWYNADGAVFENIDNCIIDKDHVFALEQGKLMIFEPPIFGHEYVAGLDVAKRSDYLALLIADRWTGRLVAALRINKRTYNLMESIVVDALILYTARTLVDVTGAGEAVFDHLRVTLQERYAMMDPYPEKRAHLIAETLTAQNKGSLIDGLALVLRGERFRFPHIRQLVGELRVFEKNVMKSGHVQHGAPRGLHDDLVIASALLAKMLPPPPRIHLPDFTPVRKGGWSKLRG